MTPTQKFILTMFVISVFANLLMMIMMGVMVGMLRRHIRTADDYLTIGKKYFALTIGQYADTKKTVEKKTNEAVAVTTAKIEEVKEEVKKTVENTVKSMATNGNQSDHKSGDRS